MSYISFAHPYAFILLGLIWCIYKCPATLQKRLFPHTALFTQHTHWFHKEKLLYSIILFLLVTALATPIRYSHFNTHTKKGRDLVFLLDTSGSMAHYGFSKTEQMQSKFEILKKLLAQFIAQRFDDNIGVSVFGSFAFSAVPITYDTKSVLFLLQFLDVGLAGENTAIGDGIDNALQLLHSSNAKSKVIILITDGYQNSGNVSIQQAVDTAQKQGVKIYTIGVGKPIEYDKKLLKKIAQTTNARMFQATNATQLQEVYTTLNTLQPSPIKAHHFLHKEHLFALPLAIATLLLFFLLSRRSFLL